MKDFSQMSDEELAQIAFGKSAPEATQSASHDMSSMSDEELQQIAFGKPMPPPATSTLGKIGKGALWALEKVDSVTGAPTRAALDAAIDGKNPISAFSKQFAESPELAPTGKTIAQKVGVTDKTISDVLPDLYNETGEGLQLQKGGWADISGSGAAGLGVDLLADWSNLVGAGLVKGGAKAAAKGTSTAVKEGAKVAGKGLLKGAAKGVDIASGSKVGSEALEGLAKHVTPKVADDYARFLEIAKKNQIDPSLLPSAVEFGPTSFISRAERHLAEGPIGQARLDKHKLASDAVQTALEGKVSKIANGNVLDEVSAGQHLRDSFDRGVDKFFSGIDWTHNAVMANAPGLQLSEKGAKMLDSKLAGVEKYAKGLSTRGVTNTQREQAKQLLAAVDAIRSSNGSYKQIHEAQKMIGDAAFKAKNVMADIPPDVQKLRDIYFSIDDALIDTAKSNLGDDIGNSLVANNKAMSEFFGEKGVLSPIIGSKNVSNEQVFRSLISNGDSRKIEALKKILPPEDLNALKGAFLESITRRGADGSVQLGNLRGSLQGKRNQLKALFSPEEIAEIDELVELGERMGPAVLSSSGTGASNSFRQLGSGVLDAVGGNAVVERMKTAARGGAPIGELPLPPKPPQPSLNKIKNAVTESFDGPLSPLGDSRGVQKVRAAALGAKVVSTDSANEKPSMDLVRKIDLNPELLSSIKNPNLKRQLQIEVQKIREQRQEQSIEKALTPERSAQDSFIDGN